MPKASVPSAPARLAPARLAPVPDLLAAEPIPESGVTEVLRLLRSGDLFRYAAEGSPVALLEAEFAALLGARYALALSSCSAAIFLALRALDLPPGARVLLPAFTFAAVPSAVVHAGGQPVLVECGDDLRLDLDDLAVKLPGAAVLLVSHMRGHTSDMDRILSLAAAAGVPVVEDAAHSLGTTWAGRPIGTLGALGCFSFQSYKMLNAGEGGLLVTDDAELVARAAVMSGAYERNWSRHPIPARAAARWQGRLPLYNLRMSNLSAAVIRAQLGELPRRVADGRRNHDRVAARLAAHPAVTVPAPLPPERRAPDSVQFLLDLPEVGLCAVTEACAARGLPLQVLGLAPGNARAFWTWEFLEGPAVSPSALPRTRAMLMRCCDLRLPARLTLAECDAVADHLLAAVEDATAPRRPGARKDLRSRPRAPAGACAAPSSP